MPSKPERSLTIAVFDFDGTLTRCDSFFPFLWALVGRWRFFWGVVRLSPILAGYSLKLIPNWRAKESMLTYFLAGKSASQLAAFSQRFADDVLPKLLRPEAIARLRWHQQQGHRTIVVSASLEIYLRPWATRMDIDQVIGTRLESHRDRLTGRILGKNCYGPEKVSRLQSFVGQSQPVLYAYGDSRGDHELLAAAKYPYYRKFQD
ncbi:HAD-IB family hydrolase [Leptolyngbya sp. BC1307]|uniref:HAD-IB family hydrolase n=1 Tax=Leptolyngbya sp. BC1307 TaxID=2029589 RepID=UPI000EFCF825|nr:HAD-IB family hydrolase [Leptolyngbya sp. BC1307]